MLRSPGTSGRYLICTLHIAAKNSTLASYVYSVLVYSCHSFPFPQLFNVACYIKNRQDYIKGPGDEANYTLKVGDRPWDYTILLGGGKGLRTKL